MSRNYLKNKGFINPNMLMIIFIVPMMLTLLINANLSILSSSVNFKTSIQHYHSLASSIDKATQYYTFQYNPTLNMPVRIQEAEGTINHLDIEYVAITPIENNAGYTVYDIVAIADSTGAKKQIKASFIFDPETEEWSLDSIQVIKDCIFCERRF